MKQLFFIGAAALLAAACGNVTGGDENNLAKGTMSLKGEIKGMDTGSLEILYPIGDTSKSDTLKVKDGKFSYKTDVVEPTNMIIRVLGTQGEEISFFGDPGNVKVEAYRDSMWSTKVSGGPTQKLFTEFNDKIRLLMKPSENFQAAFQAAQQTDNQTEMARIRTDYQILMDSVQKYVKNHIFEIRHSALSAYLAMSFLNQPGQDEYVKLAYDTMTPAVQKSFFGGRIKKVLDMANKTAVGSIAPDFTQNDTTGNPVTLSSLRGQYVLVDFWASWCGPCRQENPNVVKAYNAYKDKGFTILGVSLDQDTVAWKKAIVDDKLSWTQVLDNSMSKDAAARLYNISTIPASYLLDKEGKIIAKDLRGDALEAKLRELMP